MSKDTKILSDSEFAKLDALFELSVKTSRNTLTDFVLAAARHYQASKGDKDASRLIIVYDKLDKLNMDAELKAICLKGGFFYDACTVKMYIATAAPHDTMANTDGKINPDFTAICRGVENEGIQKYFKKLKRNEKRADREQNPDRVNSRSSVDRSTLTTKVAFADEAVQSAYESAMSDLGKCEDIATQKLVMQAIKDVCAGKLLTEEGEGGIKLPTLTNKAAQKSLATAIDNIVMLDTFGDTSASKGNKETGLTKVDKAAKLFLNTTQDMLKGFPEAVKALVGTISK